MDMENVLNNFDEEEIYEANCRIAAFNAAQRNFEEECVLLHLLTKKRKRSHLMYKQRSVEGAHIVLVDRYLMDDDTKFREYFRLTPYLFSSVLCLIKDDIDGTPTNWIKKPITAHKKLCITLRYLATGESFRSLAFQYRAHASTVGRIVKQCLTAIVTHLLHKAIPQPTGEANLKHIHDYFAKWNFPNCCGAIDGKHVRVKCPSNAGSAFFNYKDFHSIVLLAIVDANYKFIAVDVGSYGREGDAGIYAKSEMGKLISCGQFNIPQPMPLPDTNLILPNVILGDEAFALHTNLMKPYPRQASLHDQTKARYNYRHSRARRTSENAFGVMASYFRIFFTPIDTNVEKIDYIVLAACILHNMMRNEKINAPSEAVFGNFEHVIMPTQNLIPMSSTTGRPSADASAVREKFKEYFNGVGALPWQGSSQ